MNSRLVSLHFSQLTKAWNKSKYNVYSDTEKNEYHKSLEQLYSLLEKEDFEILNDSEIWEKNLILKFFFKSLEFLDKSTHSQIPFEIVHCLKVALDDWIDSGDKYIIVTSFVNDINAFSFDPSLATNNKFYDLVKLNYNILFKAKLIQINIPTFLSRDYLANVVLYHELGHFINLKDSITEALYDEMLLDYIRNDIKGRDLVDFLKYFPYLSSLPEVKALYIKNEPINILKMHLAEYYCDLFASQYIGNTLSSYLSYITFNQADYVFTHPSTLNRVELVDHFLSKKSDSYTLNKFKEAIKRITKKDLQIRYTEIKTDDFENLIPIEILHETELHYLYIHGWKIWSEKPRIFEEKNKMDYKLPDINIYRIINNLIEKSIANHIIKTGWAKAKKNVSTR